MICPNIDLEDYVRNMIKAFNKMEMLRVASNKDFKEGVLKLEAEMFFKVFGKEISQKMQKAFDVELEKEEKGNDEYYKVLVIFFTGMGSEDTRKFLGYLSIAMKEKDEG